MKIKKKINKWKQYFKTQSIEKRSKFSKKKNLKYFSSLTGIQCDTFETMLIAVLFVSNTALRCLTSAPLSGEQVFETKYVSACLPAESYKGGSVVLRVLFVGC